MTRYEAFISGVPSDIGMSSVIVARFRGPAAIEIGVFLVDTWCLGISLFVKGSEGPPDQAKPIHLWDAAKGDRADLLACLAAWCRGFLRVPELWPEIWRPVLARPHLAPHWKLLRAWADPATQGAIDVAVAADAAGGSLSKSVMALHAAFRARA